MKTTKHVALLRGINLAGRNRVSMTELAEIFATVGCVDVLTYIQSGNVIFAASPSVLKNLPQLVTDQIAKRLGHRVPVIIRSAAEIARTVRDNPFPESPSSEKALHVYFLAELPDARAVNELDPDRSPPDTFRIRNREVYVHLPKGMARTKLTNAYFDSKLSTTSTARNWATVCKLLELMQPAKGFK